MLSNFRPIIPWLHAILTAPLELAFPRCCAGCNRRLGAGELGICFTCRIALEPYSSSKTLQTERFAIFPVKLDAVLAGFAFSHGNIARDIIHSIKYNHNKAAGIALGVLLAEQIAVTAKEYDLIVPIPVHIRKEVLRGYNQAHIIAQGLSKATGIPVSPKALKRLQNSASQTSLGRSKRIAAMEGAFTTGKDFPEKGLRLLLLDDVLTTGATLSAAAAILAKSAPEKLTIVAATVDV